MAKLTTGVVRLSYANIAQPRKNDDGKAKYSSQIIIDKTDKKTIKAFERAIEELKADPKALAKVEGKAAYLKLNLRDGDTDEAVSDQPEVYADKFFINANSDKQPIVFNRDKIKMDDFDIEEEIYDESRDKKNYKNKPFYALETVINPKYIVPKRLEEKVRKIFE